MIKIYASLNSSFALLINNLVKGDERVLFIQSIPAFPPGIKVKTNIIIEINCTPENINDMK